jgi:hypothetical protein
MKLRTSAALAAIMLACAAGGAIAKPSLAPSVATPEAADKTVVIKPTTRSVNVFQNDTVLFKVGAKQFAIRFDGNKVNYDLSTLAPPGVLTRKVKVYVAPNPMDHEQGIP